MVNSRSKGKRGELEVAAFIRKRGFKARRGQQFSGSSDSPDVVHNMEGFHVEVKFVEQLQLYKALEQAKADCKEGDIPVVFHRRKNQEWVVIMPADDFMDKIIEELFDHGEE